VLTAVGYGDMVPFFEQTGDNSLRNSGETPLGAVDSLWLSGTNQGITTCYGNVPAGCSTGVGSGVCSLECDGAIDCPGALGCVNGSCAALETDGAAPSDGSSVEAGIRQEDSGSMRPGETDEPCFANFPPGGCSLWRGNDYGDPFMMPQNGGFASCGYTNWIDGCVEYALCTIECTLDEDCPSVEGVEVTPRCWQDECLVECGPTSSCPRGMACVEDPDGTAPAQCRWAMDSECPMCPRHPGCSNW
jgi:hypothetical protein